MARRSRSNLGGGFAERDLLDDVARLGGLSLHGALQRTNPFRVPHRLGEKSRSDHRREQNLGFLIGRRAVRRAGLRQVIEKLRVQGFRPVPVGLA